MQPTTRAHPAKATAGISRHDFKTLLDRLRISEVAINPPAKGSHALARKEKNHLVVSLWFQRHNASDMLATTANAISMASILDFLSGTKRQSSDADKGIQI